MINSLSFRRFFPNFFTMLNLSLGFLSVLRAHTGDYTLAAWLIVMAAIADTLDGIMAKLTKSASQFGVELDSLADVVSFGFAPAFLIYLSILNTFGLWGIVITLSFLIAGGFRLARFNTQLVNFGKSEFKGLPIPSAALAVSSLIIYFDGKEISSELIPYIGPFILSLAFLMVSHIKYDTLPRLSLNGIKEKPFLSFFLLLSIISLILTSGRSLIYIFIIFILFGIFRHIFTLVSRFHQTAENNNT